MSYFGENTFFTDPSGHGVGALMGPKGPKGPSLVPYGTLDFFLILIINVGWN